MTTIEEMQKKIKELEANVKRLEYEKDLLMAVTAGNYKRADEFKALCRDYWDAEYIELCKGDSESGLLGEYFDSDNECYIGTEGEE